MRDAPSDERALQPSDVPGTLINIALFNLTSNDQNLRAGAYNLVNELSTFFKYETLVPTSQVEGESSMTCKVRLTLLVGLLIPNNSLGLVVELSGSFATSAPHLTLDFLKEWTIGFTKADLSQKTACLYYVAPWLVNLDRFARPSREGGIETVEQVGEIMRSLLSVTVAEHQVDCRNIHLDPANHHAAPALSRSVSHLGDRSCLA